MDLTRQNYLTLQHGTINRTAQLAAFVARATNDDVPLGAILNDPRDDDLDVRLVRYDGDVAVLETAYTHKPRPNAMRDEILNWDRIAGGESEPAFAAAYFRQLT